MDHQSFVPGFEEPLRRPRALPPNSLLEQIEPSLQHLYNLMGEPLLVQTNDAAILDAASETFGRFPDSPGSSRPPLVLRLFVHDEGAASESGHAHLHPRPVVRTQGHLLYVSAGAQNGAAVDLAQGYAFGFVTPEVARNLSFLRSTFLLAMTLTMLGVARSFIPIHVACVVKDGVSVLLRGQAGAGKSTLAYACCRREYQVLADDIAQLKVGPGGLELWGMPWTFRLLPDSASFFPELRGIPPRLQMNGEWKLEVDLDQLHPGSTVTNAQPGPVVFLERGTAPGPTIIEPVEVGEAFDELGVVWPWSVGWTEEMEQQLPQLLECGTYRLHMNGSPDQAVDALDALLAELERGAP